MVIKALITVRVLLCEDWCYEKSCGGSHGSDFIDRLQSCNSLTPRWCKVRPNLQKITNLSKILLLFKLWIQTASLEWKLSSLKTQNNLFQGFVALCAGKTVAAVQCDLMLPWFTHSGAGTMTTPNSAMLVNLNLFYNSLFFFFECTLLFWIPSADFNASCYCLKWRKACWALSLLCLIFLYWTKAWCCKQEMIWYTRLSLILINKN